MMTGVVCSVDLCAVNRPYARVHVRSTRAHSCVGVPQKVDHSVRSEAQLHEGDRVWGGSVERSCEPMGKNRMEGAAE